MPTYVATRTLTNLTWNASRIEGDIPAAVAKLKEQPGQDILVAGSGQLVHTLMQNNLVDEYRLLLHPFILGRVILGRGRPLFREGLDARTLKLVDSKPTSTGVLILTYHPVEGSRNLFAPSPDLSPAVSLRSLKGICDSPQYPQ